MGGGFNSHPREQGKATAQGEGRVAAGLAESRALRTGVRRILSLQASGLPSSPEGPWVSPRGPVVPACTFRLLLHHR